MGWISYVGDVLGSCAGTLVPPAAGVTQRSKLFTESESPACHQGPHASFHAGVVDGWLKDPTCCSTADWRPWPDRVPAAGTNCGTAASIRRFYRYSSDLVPR